MFYPRRILTAALFTLALPIAACAQNAPPARLAPGTWQGTITTPGNNEATNLTYEVEYKAEKLAVTMVVADDAKFPLNDIIIADKKITFSFTPGPKVACELNWHDKGYIGQCKDDDGNLVPITMVPPAKSR